MGLLEQIRVTVHRPLTRTEERVFIAFSIIDVYLDEMGLKIHLVSKDTNGAAEFFKRERDSLWDRRAELYQKLKKIETLALTCYDPTHRTTASVEKLSYTMGLILGTVLQQPRKEQPVDYDVQS